MNKGMTLRSLLFFVVACIGFVIIIIHLYSLQVIQHNFFSNLGRQQYQVTLQSFPARALVYDRYRNPLALNKDSIAAFVLPKKIEQKKKLEDFLQQYFPAALERLNSHKDAHFLYIKRKLSDEEISLIERNNIIDIKLLHEPNRFYPLIAAGPIVGITDIDNNGIFGIELLYNNVLSGMPTTFYLEKDARSGHFSFNKETKLAGKEGMSITLTIDSDLQFFAYEELAETVKQFNAQEGAVIIMNPINGEILAMTQYPTFDPNNTQQLLVELTKNKTVTDSYEFGSVIKIFLALAALQEGVVQTDELINCDNCKVGYVNGVKISTWPHGHGNITFEEVIEFSNNIGVAKVALRLGPKLYDYYKAVGFGTKTGLSWPGEQIGFVNPPHLWTKPSIISLSFGYEITATLLQLTRAFCIIANGGILIRPKIILEEESYGEKTPFSPEILKIIKDILEKTVIRGTAKKAQIKGYRIMGKTGTANLVVDGVYNYESEHNIYTFVCIIEYGDYKRVITTFIKGAQGKNLFASMITVPLAERIAQRLLLHDKVIAQEHFS